MISIALIGLKRNNNTTLSLSSKTKPAVIGRDRNVNKGARLSSASKSALIGRARNVNKAEDSCRISFSVQHYQTTNKRGRKHLKTIKVISSDLDVNQYKSYSPQRINPVKKEKVRGSYLTIHQKHGRAITSVSPLGSKPKTHADSRQKITKYHKDQLTQAQNKRGNSYP